MADKNVGKIIQVISAVLDIKFSAVPRLHRLSQADYPLKT